MAEDEGDYHIESTDAGASATIPMEAGQVRQNFERADGLMYTRV
jgi:hypothetical protein